jgi:hypothetical protein
MSTGTGLPGFTAYMAANPMATYWSTWQAAEAAQAAEIAQLQAQLQPRTVRDVISFAYIEEMSTRYISDLLTKQHDEITMLRNVVKEVADQFDGGPDHPWIPGFNAKKIYNKVMMASVPLCSAQSDDSPE